MGSLWTTEDKTSALICNKPSLDMVNSNIFLDFSINYHYLSLVGNCHCLKKTVLATFFVERLTDRFVTWTCSDHKTAEPSKVMFATVLFKFINVRMSGVTTSNFVGCVRLMHLTCFAIGDCLHLITVVHSILIRYRWKHGNRTHSSRYDTKDVACYALTLMQQTELNWIHQAISDVRCWRPIGVSVRQRWR